MIVRTVDPASRRDVNRFVMFPFGLYRKCPQWVPPLISDEKAAFDSRRHSFYSKGTATFLLAEDRGRVVGRLALLNNRHANKHLGTHTGAFAAFDAVDDLEVAAGLFGSAADWCHLSGLDTLQGPVSLTAGASSGILVEGFEHRPPLTQPYNYPYYERLITGVGFEKDRDSLQGYISAAQQLPPRLYELAEQVKKRRGFAVKSFTSATEAREWTSRVARLNSVFAYDDRYVPMTEAEIRELADLLLTLADPRLLKLIMKGDDIIGFIFSYHDISEGLQKARGHLWPFGWFHLLRARRTTKWCNVNGVGLLPEYQGLGANVILYTEIDRTLRDFGFEHAYAVAIGEDNFKSKSDMENMGIRWVQRHRSYTRAVRLEI